MRHAVASDGMVRRRVRLAERDVVLLGAILNGEDHLASLHAEGRCVDREGRVEVEVQTTDSRAAELDTWLAELTEPLALELELAD
jgi:hypothetical protein